MTGSSANTEEYYKEKLAEQKRRVLELERNTKRTRERADALENELKVLKEGRAWQLSAPMRELYHRYANFVKKVKRYGSLRGVLKKLKSKLIERRVRLKHGSKGFPDADRISLERNTKFSKKIKFSILTPLYNTPEKYLKEMIESVQNQTYVNWELCLADGSDDEHSYVGDICREYGDSDSRVVYRKLPCNKGISENTNECLKNT